MNTYVPPDEPGGRIDHLEVVIRRMLFFGSLFVGISTLAIVLEAAVIAALVAGL